MLIKLYLVALSKSYLTYRNHRAKFEIDMIILTCLNFKNDLTVMDGRIEPNFRTDSRIIKNLLYNYDTEYLVLEQAGTVE